MANRTAKAWGGVDVGGTKIEAIVVDSNGHLLGQARHHTPHKGGPPAIVKELFETLAEAAVSVHLEPGDLTSVGVGVPGTVDSHAGTLARAGNLDGWEQPYPLARALSALAGVPVYLGNDVQVAVNAEFRLGASRRYRSLLGVWWGTGIGGGLVLNGQYWTGRGAAGEIGHTVVREGGAHCQCGRHGCLEAYAGRAAMEREAIKAAKDGEKTILFELMTDRKQSHLVSHVWERALHEKDKLAERLIDRAVDMLGVSIGSAINLLDVEAVVIGGGLGTRLGTAYVERIAQAMARHLYVPDRPPDVSLTSLGDLSGALGAALLVAPSGWHLREPRGGPEPTAHAP